MIGYCVLCRNRTVSTALGLGFPGLQPTEVSSLETLTTGDSNEIERYDLSCFDRCGELQMLKI